VALDTVEDGFGETRLSREKAKRTRTWTRLEESFQKGEIVTGLRLLRKSGVPFLERDPYARSAAGWGVLTLLHDLAALLSVFLILVHVYFGILPEKRAYLRAMIRGYITRSALAEDHDVKRVERGE
jgi:hypothetical protein